ncbi:MAG: TonB-dependent hemoglobin/transferrin/lactoferrin family receptor [Thermostichales cyanobacterium DRC_bins_46]
MNKLKAALLLGVLVLVWAAPTWGQGRISELRQQLEAAEARGDRAEAERIRTELERWQAAPSFELEQITVTGTRTPRSVGESPGTVTVIDAERARRELSRTIRDLVRYEPGVSVRGNLRYGLQDFNIRGLDANRVLIQVDGIRQPERFSFGPFALGRDYFEIETLRTVEIVRGPASTLYGSDALGGVVTFATLEPQDLLQGQPRHTGFASGFSSASGEWVNTVSLAAQEGNTEALLIYTRRDRRETSINGDASLVDPNTTRGNNVLGKLIFRLNDSTSLRLVGEYFQRHSLTTTAARNLGTGVSFFNEDVETHRLRLSAELRYENPATPGLELGSVQVYYQPAETIETSLERRTVMGQPVRRDTVNSLVSDIVGIQLQGQSRFQSGDVSHRVVYGLDLSSAHNSRPRDRVQTNLLTGAQTRVIPPDVFPTKDFPDSDTIRFGIYLQDEISFSDRFTLIPGIRYDSYSLTPKPDRLFTQSGAESASLNTGSLSPKLGMVWKVSDTITLTAQYAAGFRAPQYNEINSGFTNLVSPFFRYRTLSNPNLRPETSQSFEIGIRGLYPQGSFRIAAYYNTYSDFIEAFREVGSEPSPPDNPGPPVILFQSQNVSSARIYGLEAQGQYFFSPDLTGWNLRASLAWAVGDDLTANKPLISIDPLKVVLGLNYDDPSLRWGVSLITTLVAAPRDPERPVGGNPPPAPPSVPFVAPGYTVVDVIGYWNLDENWQLNFGILNLFDQRYFLYSETRTLFQGPAVERFAQPGRSVAIGFSTRF